MPESRELWKPLAAGALYFLGQVAAFKLLLVALLATLLLNEHLKVGLWIAAALSATAIYFLRDPGNEGRARSKVGSTMAYATLTALAFAAFDISVQTWSPQWSVLSPASGFGLGIAWDGEKSISTAGLGCRKDRCNDVSTG